MRLGILLGFLIGAAIAALLGQKDAQQAGPTLVTPDGGLMDKLKRQAEEARAAAREASEQKQAEMLRDWERSRHEEPQG